MRQLLCSCAVMCLFCISIAAQNTAPTTSSTTAHVEPIHIILDGAHKPGECMVEGRAVDREVRELQYPAGWTVAIMCTPVRWEEILQQVNPPRTDAAFTRISQRITVVNGAIFHEFPSHARHILAHELAHIQCNCADEYRVEKLAFTLEKTHVRPRVERAATPAAPATSTAAPTAAPVAVPAEALH
jgi:hypothetical protein